MEHTPKTWKFEYMHNAMKWWIYEGSKLICSTEGGDHARRIAAALNAVEGIETEMLEALPLNFKEHALELDRMKAENARLRALLEVFAFLDEDWMLEALNIQADDIDKRADVSDFEGGIRAARAALAETETE